MLRKVPTLLDRDFDDLVEATLENWKTPGLALAVVTPGETITKAYGLATFPSTPVTSSTNFFGASTTKAFTAAALALLVYDNEKYPQVQWTTKVNELIRDDFVLQDSWATDNLTIEDILSHRTGLPSHDRAILDSKSDGVPHGSPRPAVREVVRNLRHLPMTASPRTTYQYCNAMFIVAAHIIETLTGQWLGTFLHERIWKPLGMVNTYFSTEDALAASAPVACGYYYDQEKQQYVEVPHMNLDTSSGAGSIISNVEDYSKWAVAIMTRSNILPEAAWDELLTPRTIMGQPKAFTGPLCYALGWTVGVYKGHRFIWHSGGLDAFSTQFTIFPDLKYAVITFANTAGSGYYAEQALSWHLIDEKLGVPLADRVDWDKQNKEAIEKGKDEAANALDRFYPGVDRTAGRSYTLPLEAYTGTYCHPGYHKLQLRLADQAEQGQSMESATPRVMFRADRDEASWPEHMSFEHVTRDYFLIRSDWTGDFAAFWPEMYAAEFRIGPDDKVVELGIAGWEPKMGKEKIWLRKVD